MKHLLLEFIKKVIDACPMADLLNSFEVSDGWNLVVKDKYADGTYIIRIEHVKDKVEVSHPREWDGYLLN